jgi:hypothetical protein
LAERVHHNPAYPAAQMNGFHQCVAPLPCRRIGLNGTIDSTDSSVPECRDILFQQLTRLDSVFQRLNVSYYLGFGTLLGSLQIANIHSWALDIDIVITAQAFTWLLTNSTANAFLQQHGFLLFRGGLLRMCFIPPPDSPKRQSMPKVRRLKSYLERFPYVDLYMEFRPSDNLDSFTRELLDGTSLRSPSIYNVHNMNIEATQLKINPSECMFQWRDVYPLQHCLIRNNFFPCPKRAHHLLSTHYGPLYLQPRDTFDAPEVDHFGCLQPARFRHFQTFGLYNKYDLFMINLNLSEIKQKKFVILFIILTSMSIKYGSVRRLLTL